MILATASEFCVVVADQKIRLRPFVQSHTVSEARALMVFKIAQELTKTVQTT